MIERDYFVFYVLNKTEAIHRAATINVFPARHVFLRTCLLGASPSDRRHITSIANLEKLYIPLFV
jgi:hypothetical protein